MVLDASQKFNPITYNHCLTDTVQMAQKDRQRNMMAKAIEKVVGVDNMRKKQSLVPNSLLTDMNTQMVVDMEDFAGDLAMDYLQAYYKVDPMARRPHRHDMTNKLTGYTQDIY